MKELETNSRAVLAGIRNAFGLPALLLFSAMTGFGSFAQEHGLSLYMSMLSTILIWGLTGTGGSRRTLWNGGALDCCRSWCSRSKRQIYADDTFDDAYF